MRLLRRYRRWPLWFEGANLEKLYTRLREPTSLLKATKRFPLTADTRVTGPFVMQ